MEYTTLFKHFISISLLSYQYQLPTYFPKYNLKEKNIFKLKKKLRRFRFDLNSVNKVACINLMGKLFTTELQWMRNFYLGNHCEVVEELVFDSLFSEFLKR